MLRFDRRRLDALPAARRAEIGREAEALLTRLAGGAECDCALAQILGHKADLMVTHYARTFDELALAETQFDKLELAQFLQPVSSYVSILELGLYDATGKIHAELRDRGLKPHSEDWNAAFDALLGEQRREPRNAARLWAKVPARRYVCFYPLDKKRAEAVNWYRLPYAERARLMVEHGQIGRSFHGLVTQVISGSIGFADWGWGVDLYADDPLVIKKLLYEMSFDEHSAAYAAFGTFGTGLQYSIPELPAFLAGDRVPELLARRAPQAASR